MDPSILRFVTDLYRLAGVDSQFEGLYEEHVRRYQLINAKTVKWTIVAVDVT